MMVSHQVAYPINYILFKFKFIQYCFRINRAFLFLKLAVAFTIFFHRNLNTNIVYNSCRL